MIIPPRQSSITSAFLIRGTALQSVWKALLLNIAVATAITLINGRSHILDQNPISLTPFNLVGLALSIFLGFRNNACYDRFWEGRKLWGALVNTSRSLTRQLLTLIGPHGGREEASATDEEILHFRRRMVHHLIGWVHALKRHLRLQDPLQDLGPFLTAEEIERLRPERNVPVAILQMMADELSDAWRAGWIHPQHLPLLEVQLTALTDIQGGCERIRSTPIPLSFTLLTHRIVGIYTFTLPLALVTSTGWVTPIASALVAYAFLGLDAVGSQIENPFDEDPNDLPLSALAVTVEQNLRQRLGEALPPDARPDEDGVLN